MTRTRSLGLALIFAALASVLVPRDAGSASRAELNRDSVRMYNLLLKQNKAARLLAGKARAVLVFPSIVKAGFMFGGQIGEGALLRGGKPVAYYSSVAASYGLQAGVQTYGYALFFMNEGSLAY